MKGYSVVAMHRVQFDLPVSIEACRVGAGTQARLPRDQLVRHRAELRPRRVRRGPPRSSGARATRSAAMRRTVARQDRTELSVKHPYMTKCRVSNTLLLQYIECQTPFYDNI